MKIAVKVVRVQHGLMALHLMLAPLCTAIVSHLLLTGIPVQLNGICKWQKSIDMHEAQQ